MVVCILERISFMDKFIYVFNQDTYKRLLAEGFTFVCECNLGKKAYVFENSKKVALGGELTFLRSFSSAVALRYIFPA